MTMANGASEGNEVAEIFVSLGVSTDEMDGVGNEIKSKMQGAAQAMKSVGRTMTQAVTLPIAAAAAEAARTGSAIDSEFAKIEGLVGESRQALQGMRDDLFDISTATGIGPQELSQALFNVESAGFRGAEAISVLDASARAAAAGLGETREVADAVTSAVNAYGIDTLSAAEATDTLVATVREGKVQTDELANSIGRVLPLASQMGVEFSEVGGTVAALTRIGANSRRAVTALNAALLQIQKGTPKTVEGLESMGLSLGQVEQMISDEGLLPTLQMLNERFAETDTKITDVFSNSRALRGVLGLIGKNAEQAEQIFQSMNEEVGGSTADAFAAADRTIRQNFNQALREAQRLLDQVFRTFRGQLQSVLQRTIGLLSSLNDMWSNLSSQTQNIIVASGALLAALGPVLFTLGSIVAILPAVAGGLATFGSAALTAAPYLAGIAAAGGVIMQNWREVQAFFRGPGQEIWTSIQNGAQLAWQATKQAFDAMLDAAETLVDALGTALRGDGGLISLIGTRLATAFELLEELAVPVLDQIVNIFGFAVNQLARGVEIAVELLTGDFAGAWQTLKKSVQAAARFLIRSLANMVDVILSWSETIANTVPGVDIDLSSAQQSVRAFRDTVKKQMQGAREDIERVSMGPDESVFEFTAWMEEAQQVELAVSEMSNATRAANEQALAAIRSLGQGVDKVSDLYDVLGGKAQQSGQKAQEAAQRWAETLQFIEDLSPASQGSESGADSQQGQQGDQGAGQGRDSFAQFFGRNAQGFADQLAGIEDLMAKVRDRAEEMGQRSRRAFGLAISGGRQFANQVGRGVSRVTANLITMQSDIGSVGEAFRRFAQVARNAVRQLIQQLIQAAIRAAIFKAILSVASGGAGGGIGAIGTALPGGGLGGPAMAAEGGITPPRATSVIAGEGGEREAIMPLSKLDQLLANARMSGGQANVNVNVSPSVTRSGDLLWGIERGKSRRERLGLNQTPNG